MQAIAPDSIAKNPDASALFQAASNLDSMGCEKDALPLYEQILRDGYETLPLCDQHKLFIQLGSTLRNLGHFAKARDVLRQGEQLFPDNRAVKAFIALVEFSDRNPARTAQILMDALMENNDPSLKEYERALRWYFEELSVTGKK